MKTRLFAVLSILIVLSMVLAACAQTTAEPETVVETVIVEGETTTIVETVEVVTTVEVEKIVEVVPTVAPSTRTGAWVDQVVFTSIDDANSAVSQLQAGELDAYAYSVGDPELYKTVQADPGLVYSTVYGSCG